jgi:hypothetical protein
MRIAYKIFFLVAVLLAQTSVLLAQTCSCAGTPLLGSQSLGATTEGNLVLGLTYEYHEISSLYNGTERLNNETARRNTQSLLFEANYGITGRLSVTGTFTYTQKYRKTGLQNPAFSESLATTGIGDGLFLLKYTLHRQTLWEPYQISIGGGAKVPFGSFSLTNNGLPLNADMQPGTGAWDGVFWSYLSRTLRAHDINIFMTNSYRLTGSAERFGSSDEFRFGNEFVSELGAGGPLVDKLSYMFTVRYRSTSSDRRNGEKLPTTGGKWLYLKPSLNYQFSDRISARISGKLPAYQHLNGTQPSTTFTLSGSIFFSLNKNDSGFIYGNPNSR